MRLSFRPLPIWPYRMTAPRRSAHFRVPYQQTLDDLDYELGRLGGSEIVLGIGLTERDIRRDGQPRADAKAVSHPGVEVSFDSRYGRLTYATDQYNYWRDNLRAITLSLEALRAVDRYGVSKRGEQYAGWAQLPAGGPDAERGRRLVEEAGGIVAALKRHHPDAGGAERDFIDVQAFRALTGDA